MALASILLFFCRRDVNDPHIIFRSLPSVLFPEYQHVHAMMAAREPVDGYEAFPMHSVVEFKDDNKVRTGTRNKRASLA